MDWAPESSEDDAVKVKAGRLRIGVGVLGLAALAALAVGGKTAPKAASRPPATATTAPSDPPSTRPADRPTVYTPTSGYTLRQIEGWKSIYVHNDLLTGRKKLGQEVLKLLQAKLYEVSRVVPPAALAELRKVPIWMEYKNPKGGAGCYHPSRRWLETHGFNPDKARSVEFGNAQGFLNTSRHQPSVVLHELAHAYHHRVLPGGYGNKELKAAHKRVLAGKTYDSVLHVSGRKRRAYAMTNPMEYFAELSEAFFGTNDFYPFVRAEVKTHDPQMYKLLNDLWNRPPAKAGDSKGKDK